MSSRDHFSSAIFKDGKVVAARDLMDGENDVAVNIQNIANLASGGDKDPLAALKYLMNEQGDFGFHSYSLQSGEIITDQYQRNKGLRLQFGNFSASIGCHVVVAASGGGKSYFINQALASSKVKGLDYSPIVFREPESHPMMNTMFALCQQMTHDLSNYGFVVIDSFRDFLFDTQNVGRGGLSRSVLRRFTELSAIGLQTGTLFVITLNPRTVELDALALWLDELSGATTSVSVHWRPENGEPGMVCTGRDIPKHLSVENHNIGQTNRRWTTPSGSVIALTEVAKHVTDDQAVRPGVYNTANIVDQVVQNRRDISSPDVTVNRLNPKSGNVAGVYDMSNVKFRSEIIGSNGSRSKTNKRSK